MPIDLVTNRRVTDPIVLELLGRFNAFGDYLRETLLERVEETKVALIAVLSRQHVVYFGPPGAAKSMMIEKLVELLDANIFQLLMCPFTLPGEVFGIPPISELKAGTEYANTQGKAPSADFLFLDELFKASPTILNGLLTMINERKFTNAGRIDKCPLISMFSASNELPQDESLRAFYDRILFRMRVGYIREDSNFIRMLMGVSSTPPAKMTLDELRTLQDTVDSVEYPESVATTLLQIKKELEGTGITTVSDRRWANCVPAIKAHALLSGRMRASDQDLIVCKWILWEQPDGQMTKVQRIVMEHANTFEAQAENLYDMSKTTFDDAMLFDLATQSGRENFVESMKQIRTAVTSVGGLLDQARDQGMPIDRIEYLHRCTRDYFQRMSDRQQSEFPVSA